MTNHRGFTLVELLVASAIVAALLLFVQNFFAEGQRTIETTRRKIDAIGQTHLRFEELRHELETAAWAWAPPEPTEHDGLALGGGPVLYVEGREYAFDGRGGILYAAGRPRSGIFRDVRFWGQEEFLVKFCVSCDRAASPPTRRSPARECSTLVSKVFVEAQAEEVRHRNHVFEADHAWCVMGAPIHFAFDD